MKKILFFALCSILLVLSPIGGMASDEGTRHITGDDIDLYFMNDKLFGHVKKHPLWAIYNCGSDIKGTRSLSGTCLGTGRELHTW